ncbi:hypothetical protein XAR_4287 [Xanthomonas citri pv. glycines str. 8ra]|nr:hypothetical protein XAR_4287 [Xanthomonas citri pv. glycines str. 8ra]
MWRYPAEQRLVRLQNIALAKTQTPCGTWPAGLAGLRKQGFRRQMRLATQRIDSHRRLASAACKRAESRSDAPAQQVNRWAATCSTIVDHHHAGLSCVP